MCFTVEQEPCSGTEKWRRLFRSISIKGHAQGVKRRRSPLHSRVSPDVSASPFLITVSALNTTSLPPLPHCWLPVGYRSLPNSVLRYSLGLCSWLLIVTTAQSESAQLHQLYITSSMSTAHLYNFPDVWKTHKEVRSQNRMLPRDYTTSVDSGTRAATVACAWNRYQLPNCSSPLALMKRSAHRSVTLTKARM